MSVKAESISWMLVLPEICQWSYKETPYCKWRQSRPSIQGLRTWATTPAASLLSSSPRLISPSTLRTASPPDSSLNLNTKHYWLPLLSSAEVSPDDSLQDAADGAEGPQSGDPGVSS